MDTQPNNDYSKTAEEIYFVPRAIALLIDAVLVAVAYSFLAGIILFPMLAFSFQASYLLSRVLWLAMWAGYFGFMFSYKWQASVGMRLMGVYVVNEDDSKLTLQQGLIRGAAMFLSGLPLGLGYLLPFVHAEKKTLHDLLCKTKVVLGKQD